MGAPKPAPLPVADRWLAAKFTTIGLWSVLFAMFLPVAYRGNALISSVIVALAVVTAAGAALAVVGLVRRDNLVTEVAGLFAMLAGPVSWLILVSVVGIATAVQQQGTDRIAVIVVAVLQVEVVAARLHFLLRRRSEVTHDDVPVRGAR